MSEPLEELVYEPDDNKGVSIYFAHYTAADSFLIDDGYETISLGRDEAQAFIDFAATHGIHPRKEANDAI